MASKCGQQALFKASIPSVPAISFSPYDVSPDVKKFVVTNVSGAGQATYARGELDGKSEAQMILAAASKLGPCDILAPLDHEQTKSSSELPTILRQSQFLVCDWQVCD